MQKIEAIRLLGGTVQSAADALGISYQAVSKWEPELSQRITDRVHAALWRVANGIPHPAPSAEAEDDDAVTKKHPAPDTAAAQG